MRTLISILLIWVLAETAGRADISDIRIREDAGQTLVFVTFDVEPLAVLISPDESGAAIMFEGVTATPFTLSPRSNGTISTITASPIEGGVILHLTGSGIPWGRVSGDVTAGGGLVRIAFESVQSASSQTGNVPDAVMTIMPHVEDADIERSPDAESALVAEPEMDAQQDLGADTESGPVDDLQAAASTPVDLIEQGPPGEPCAATAATVERDPWDLDALTAQAQCLAGQGNGDAARPLLERVLAFEPSRFEAAFMLADITEDSGDTDAAMALFEQAADAARTDGQAVAARARARALAQD